MSKITHDYITEMGETGAGIRNTSEIDMSVSNALTNKWGTLFQTPTVTRVFQTTTTTPDPRPASPSTAGALFLAHVSRTSPRSRSSPLPTNDLSLSGDDSSGKTPFRICSPPSAHAESEPIDLDDEQTAASDTKPVKTRPPKPSTSKPAAAPTVSSRPTKKSKLAEFSEIAKSEEKSRHKELDLAALKTRQLMKTTEVR
ncbi:hypothetical protein K438DRAFT_1848511, partial [Mycena galopus ATCC 62051]